MDRVIKLFVNGAKIVIDDALLKSLFHLDNKGRKCGSQEFKRDTPEGPAYLLNIDFIVK